MNAEEINRFFNSFYRLDHEEYSFNPYLRISKATKSKMKLYNLSVFDKLIYQLDFVKITLPLVVIIRIVFNSIFNLLRFAVYHKPKKSMKKTDVLFLSHLTLRNLNTFEDSFYGPLPDYLKKLDKKISMIYTNQTRKISRLKIKEKDSTNNLLIPKYLELKELIKYFIVVTKSIQFSLNEVKTRPLLNSDERLLISKACFSFLRIETMMNFHLIEITKKTIIDCQPSYVFMTLEGHIYENSIYLNCKNSSVVRQIFMFQNSPIGPSQFGLFDFVKHNGEKLTYLVQGNAFKKLILEENETSQVLVVGRKEDNFDVFAANRKTENPKLLLVPDGDKFNVMCHLDLTKYFYSNVSSEIVISLHPDTRIGLYNKMKLRSLMRKGFIKQSISNLNMETVAKYDLLAYTSSNIAMKSLLLEIGLIYVSNSNYNLDPLWLIKEGKIDLVEKEKSKLNIEKYAKKEYYELYSELNYKRLENLIIL
jgi:hypothetical protein